MAASSAHVAGFAATALASSALNNVFVTYYLSALLGGGACVDPTGRRWWLTGSAALTPAWFFLGQSLFCAWNAVNDPLLGWLSDSTAVPRAPRAPWLRWCARVKPQPPLSRRSWAVRWGGLAWAAAFALAWFPPRAAWFSGNAAAAAAGLHFLAAISVYDAALTFVEVNHSALLAELYPAHRGTPQGGEAQRARANAFAGIAAALGSLSSFPAHVAWEADCAQPVPGSGGWLSGAGGWLGTAGGWLSASGGWLGAGGWGRVGHFRTFSLVLAVVCAVVFWVAAAALDCPFPSKAAAEEEKGGVAARTASINGGKGQEGDCGSGASAPSAVAVAGTALVHPVADAAHQHALSDSALPDALADCSTGSSGTVIRHAVASASSSAAALPSHPLLLPPLPPVSRMRVYATFLARGWALPPVRAYVAIASLQAFDCAFGKSFFAQFLGALTDAAGGPGDVGGRDAWRVPTPAVFGPAALAAIVCASFLLPHALTVALQPCVARRGVHTVVRRVFAARFALAALAAAVSAVAVARAVFASASPAPRATTLLRAAAGAWGAHWPFLPMAAVAYQLISRVASEAVCRSMPLLRSRLVDAAHEAAERDAVGIDAALVAEEGGGSAHPHPAPFVFPAALIGAADFLPKVAASAAPLLGFLATDAARRGTGGSGWVGGGTSSAGMGLGVWVPLVAVSAATSLVQLLLWTRLTHGAKLSGVDNRKRGPSE